MTPFSFDTLRASKQLREAGMEQGVAEAVVAVFQHAYEPLDISHLATKEDIADMATKSDIASMATKADIADMATKADIARMATKADIADMATKADIAHMATKADIADMATRAALRSEIMASELRVRETIRLQGWALMGGVGLMLAVFGGIAGLLA